MMLMNVIGPLSIWYRRIFLAKPPPRKSTSPLPGVTIIRPLKGMDNDLVDNLRSSFVQEYDGPYEIIFSVASADDKAVQVVEELKSQFPHIDAKLIVGEVPVGVNPKVRNMLRPYDAAKHPIIWILDSNVHVPPQTLSHSVHLLDNPKVGLVHHLPTATDPQSYGSRLEYAFLNTSHAKMYSSINSLDIASCVVGKSTLFRKSDLDRLSPGGFRGLGNTMSEDNAIGVAIKKGGMRHVMGPQLAQQALGAMPVKAYFDRRGRWIRIRVHTVPVPTILEMFSESIVSSIIGSWAVSNFFGVERWKVVMFHFAIWMMADFLIGLAVDEDVGRSWRGFWRFWSGWVGREVTAFPLWAVSVCGRVVMWRGRRYVFHRGGRIVEEGREGEWGGDVKVNGGEASSSEDVASSGGNLSRRSKSNSPHHSREE
ncbi:hypothetical protein HDV00_001823 [Rhizophlyctis rosea]|nr:hypothetical protein HDV00_001823 [Rhizophlyctis rosea]